MGEGAILKLMEAVDNYIPEPTRVIDKPFIMPMWIVQATPTM